jgi:prefoldin subunit 5
LLLGSAKLEEIRQSLSLLQGQIEQLKARKASVEAHEAVKTTRTMGFWIGFAIIRKP